MNDRSVPRVSHVKEQKLDMYEMKTLFAKNFIPLRLVRVLQSSNKMWDMKMSPAKTVKRQVIVTGNSWQLYRRLTSSS